MNDLRRILHPRRCLGVAIAVLGSFGAASAHAESKGSIETLAEFDGATVALERAADGGSVLATNDAGRGRVLRLDAAGDVVALTELGASIDDLAASDTGEVVVATADTLFMLDDALVEQWRTRLDARAVEAHRVAIGVEGTVAVVDRRALRLFDADGQALGRATLALDEVGGVAVNDAADLVVVAGTRSRLVCDEWVDDAVLLGFDRSGAPRWDAFGEDSTSCGVRPAETRMIDVVRGEDGQIYALGEVQGSRSKFEDAATTSTDIGEGTRAAFGARVSTDGRISSARLFGFDAAFAEVHPASIAADVDGHLFIGGRTTHTFEPGEDEPVETLGAAAGFSLVLGADLSERRAWQTFELDDPDVTPVFALDSDAVRAAVRRVGEGGVAGTEVLTIPADPDLGKPGRRPDRDDVGTFGYESGVSGSDPTCYCDARRNTPGSVTWFGLVLAGLGLRRRRAKARG